MHGFDIGTTQSKTAHVNPTGKPSIISNARGEQVTDSALYLPETGEALIGRDAIEQSVIDPTRFLSNFKLKLGSTENLLNDGQIITPTDATAILIAQKRKDAENFLGIEVSEVVATCPANFRDDAKQALKEAFQRNNMKVLRLVPEPTAAAEAYANHKSMDRAKVAVYDFGGGTFDSSVIGIDGSQINVLATSGVAKLGGNDFNQRLMERVLAAIEEQCGEKPTAESEPLLFLDLYQRVEAAKISLGTQKEVPIVVGYRGSQIIVKVTQDEFHSDIMPLVQRSFDALDEAVDAAGLKIEQIDRLIMVGGTSRMRFIQDKLADHTRLVPHTDIDPEHAIAFGAALACVTEMKRQGKSATLHGQVIPTPDVFVRDVCAHDVGCCVVDKSGHKSQLVNAVIVPKNTPIPCQRTDRFYLEEEKQTEAHIEILQGTANADRDDCLLIGELVLDSLPTESTRTERIQVEYVIDADGMVTATATDLVSKKTQTVSVDYKKGIKPREKPTAV